MKHAVLLTLRRAKTTPPHPSSAIMTGKVAPDTAQPGVPAELAAHGVIVVLGVPSEVARQLAVPGGVPPEQLHLTLAFLGLAPTLGEARLEAVRDSLLAFASHTSALRARVTGVGRFSGGQHNGGLDVAYVSVDAPELPALREGVLCELAEGAGVEAEGVYGFTPHITLAFVPPSEPHPYGRVAPLDVRFETLELWVGPRRAVYALHVETEAPTPCDTTEAAEAAVGVAAPRALAAVVEDWLAPAAAHLRELPSGQRFGALRAALDDLHTRVLAAHLAAPARASSGDAPERALQARAARLRSVETDLGLIFETVARNVAGELPTLPPDQLTQRLRRALEPLLTWAAAAEASFS